MKSLVKSLIILILFTAPVVGQEAGDNVRALFKNPSSGVQSQLDSIFGAITPDLQFETKGGSIIAKDALIDPEYFVVNRPLQVLNSIGAGVGGAAVIEKFRKCDGIIDISCHGFSWPLVFTAGPVLGSLLLLFDDDPSYHPGDWKPW
jgi:hypothetical protein